jgi:hypothetical protein
VGGGGGLPFGQNRPNEPTTAAAGLIEVYR